MDLMFGIAFGLVLGIVIGFVVCAWLVAAKNADDWMNSSRECDGCIVAKFRPEGTK